MILAAIEHHARHIWATVTEALTDRARGFSDVEAGDFLTATERARQQLVEREAEEEVGEVFVDYDYTPRPRVTQKCADCDRPMLLRHVCEPPSMLKAIEDAYWCHEHGTLRTRCVLQPHQSSAHAGADTASAGTPAAEAPSPAAGVVPPAPAAGLPTRRPLPELLYAAAEAVSMPVTWGGAKQPAWRTRLAAELGDRAAELNRDAADARIAKRLNDAGFKAGEDFSAALDGQAFPDAPTK